MARRLRPRQREGVPPGPLRGHLRSVRAGGFLDVPPVRRKRARSPLVATPRCGDGRHGRARQPPRRRQRVPRTAPLVESADPAAADCEGEGSELAGCHVPHRRGCRCRASPPTTLCRAPRLPRERVPDGIGRHSHDPRAGSRRLRRAPRGVPAPGPRCDRVGPRDGGRTIERRAGVGPSCPPTVGPATSKTSRRSGSGAGSSVRSASRPSSARCARCSGPKLRGGFLAGHLATGRPGARRGRLTRQPCVDPRLLQGGGNRSDGRERRSGALRSFRDASVRRRPSWTSRCPSWTVTRPRARSVRGRRKRTGADTDDRAHRLRVPRGSGALARRRVRRAHDEAAPEARLLRDDRAFRVPHPGGVRGGHGAHRDRDRSGPGGSRPRISREPGAGSRRASPGGARADLETARRDRPQPEGHRERVWPRLAEHDGRTARAGCDRRSRRFGRRARRRARELPRACSLVAPMGASADGKPD